MSTTMSNLHLTQASRQWASRPKDERFASLDEMHQAALKFHDEAKVYPNVLLNALRVEADGEEIKLVGQNRKVDFTNWAFGQLCARVGAPASYMRDLPPTLAVQNLNHGLKTIDQRRGKEDCTAQLLLRQNGENRICAFTSDDYSRIWNHNITERLLRLERESGVWQPAPAAFDGSRGLYLSDHDMFAFMVDNGRRIFESDPNGGLSRGFFVANSDVGAKAFWVLQFLYAYVCGNHIVWGAQLIQELRIRHVGDAAERGFRELSMQLKKYAEGSSVEVEQKIRIAKSHELGVTKEEVLDAIFGLKVQGLTQKLIAEGYEKAEEHEDWYGSPRTVWGMVNGITEVARDIQYADKRVEVERAAAKIMAEAF